MLLVLAVPAALAQPAKCPVPLPNPPPVTISSQLPQDVCLPANVTSGAPFFDDFSWRSFVALVWPSKAGQRGVPDPNGVPGGSGTPVFQTYKADWEVFQPNGAKPTEWSTYEVGANPCPDAPTGAFVLAAFSKYGNLGQAAQGSFVGPLVSQNVQYTRFLAAFNQVEFDEIRDLNWYLQSGLTQNITFTPDALQNNPIDIKSAWMVMTQGWDTSRFYTTTAYVLNPSDGSCTQQTVGLVGLHIVTKTPSRPQWIWSTFEQVDLIPQPGAKKPYSYNDDSGTPMPGANPIPFPPSPEPCKPTPAYPCPFNVTRTQNINPLTITTNGNYQQALAGQGSGVWQYYKLAMTQWPNDSSTTYSLANTTPGSNTNPMTAFSNLTMETFDQAKVRNGCMACHNATGATSGATTDFNWAVALNAFPSPLGTNASQPQFHQLMATPQSAGAKRLIALLAQNRKDMAESQKAAKPPAKKDDQPKPKPKQPK
jgi:hypothetical protein